MIWADFWLCCSCNVSSFRWWRLQQDNGQSLQDCSRSEICPHQQNIEHQFQSFRRKFDSAMGFYTLSPCSHEISRCLWQQAMASSYCPRTLRVLPKFPLALASPIRSPIDLQQKDIMLLLNGENVIRHSTHDNCHKCTAFFLSNNRQQCNGIRSNFHNPPQWNMHNSKKSPTMCHQCYFFMCILPSYPVVIHKKVKSTTVQNADISGIVVIYC